MDCNQEAPRNEIVVLQEILARCGHDVRVLLDLFPVPLAIAMDRDARDIRGNRAFAGLHEMSPDANFSLGVPPEQLPPWTICRAGRELAYADLPLQRAARGEVVDQEEFDLHFLDGRIRHLLISANPICDEQGVPNGCLGAFVEITSQKRLERQLADARDYLATAQQAASVGVFDWSIPDDKVIWSPELAALFRIDPAEFEGTLAGWQKRVDPEDAARIMAYVQECWRDRRDEAHFEFRGFRPDGSVFCLDGRARFTYDENGRPVRMLGANWDITDRKNAEQEREELLVQLREADRCKDEFLALLSHELRNPLTPISNIVDMLGMSGVDAEQRERLRQVMAQQVRQLIRLTDDLLDVSRISRGKILLLKEEVDLRTVAQTAVETVQPAFDQAGHAFTATLPDCPLYVQGDPVRLTQVVNNLLVNACKFTPEHGRIELILESADGSAVMTVRDNGIGIPPEMQETIFNMFAQVQTSVERGKGGLGLGLSLVKSLVEMHGGSVTVHSEGVNRGSEFLVRLPLLPTAAEKSAVPEKPPRTRGRFQVYVIDDSKLVADTFATMLRFMGQEVEVSYDAATALERLAQTRPDVVFCDVSMPRMNGYEFVRQLRARPELRDICCVALTGFGQPEDQQRALIAGFDQHMIKPASLEALDVFFDWLSHHPPHHRTSG